MKIISSNKDASYNYFLSHELEVGFELIGQEVKAIKEHGINIKSSYVKVTENKNNKKEMWLINANIGLIEPKRDVSNRPLLKMAIDGNKRDRKLLLHKKQILKFEKLLKESGSTLILKDVYFNDKNMIKGTLCFAKGKKQYDKREVIKKRDLERSAND